MDLVARTPRFAKPGETLVGSDFYTAAGGKGANQAVAAGKLSGSAMMVGRVGNDIFGRDLLQNMQANNVDIKGISVDKNLPTGTALITVDDNAENTIIIIAGSNGAVGKTELSALDDVLSSAKLLMMQLEIPLEAIIAGAKLARKKGVKVLLDPAPARELPVELLELCDFITPNETEAQILTGIAVINADDARRAAKFLLNKGVKAVIIKMSSKGSFYYDGETEIFFPAFSVNPIDTVAAGDAFNGGFAAAFAEGKPLKEVLEWANASGALSTTKRGAQPSMPTRDEVITFLEQNKF